MLLPKLILTSLLANLSHAYFVSVDAHDEECFFEKANRDDNLGLMFEVAEGGFLDIDMKITQPNGQVLYAVERESNGKFNFAARENGIYSFCFSNKMSTVTPKIVMFNVDKLEKGQNTEEDDDSKTSKLEDMAQELSISMTGVKHEQEYMEVRERIHRSINDNTNSRVVLWAFFESVVLVAMTLGQVYYLKRFFEVRRVV